MKRIITLLTVILLSVFSSYSQDSLQMTLVKNINMTPFSMGSDYGSYPFRLTVSGGRLFFVATGQIIGVELFISDGTEAGTQLIKNINTHFTPGNPYDDDSNPHQLTPFGNNIIFSANDHIHGLEPWISDGTLAGTFILHDTDTIIGTDTITSSIPQFFTEFNNRIYFNGTDGYGAEPFVSDGTETDTYMLKDIWAPWLWSSNPNNFYEYNNLLYFNAKGSEYEGHEIWITDGTEQGTVLFKDLSLVSGGSWPSQFYEYQGKMYFAARGDSIGTELWVSDGTIQGTVLFADINPVFPYYGYEGSEPRYFTELNGKLYFWASNGDQGFELWSTDGITVHMVKDINPSSSAGYAPFHVYNNKLYFPVNLDGYSTPVLWVSDGTTSGTYQLNAYDSTVISRPKGFVNWNNQLVFLAHKYNETGFQIWSTDGTQENTKQMFHDSVLGSGSVQSDFLTLYNDEIYFGANYIDSIGSELYKIFMGPPPIEIKDINVTNNEITVYPNPVKDELIIEGLFEGDLVQIYGVLGNAIASSKVSQNPFKISLKETPDGVYFLRVKRDNEIRAFKIIKQ